MTVVFGTDYNRRPWPDGGLRFRPTAFEQVGGDPQCHVTCSAMSSTRRSRWEAEAGIRSRCRSLPTRCYRGPHHHPADGDRRAADAAGYDGRLHRRGAAAAARRRRPRRRRQAAVAPKTPPPDVNPAAAPVEAPKEIEPEKPVEVAKPCGRRGRRHRRWRGWRHCGRPRRSAAAAASAAPQGRRRSASAATSRPPTKVQEVNPVYPPIAQSARVQGVVILEATIGTDGHVTDVEGPSLDPAARCGGRRRSETVGVHADDAQRPAGAGHHDRHGEFRAAVTQA